MKKIIFTSVAAIGLFTSIVLFANTQNSNQPDYCRCTWSKPHVCYESGWGTKCAVMGNTNCRNFDANCVQDILMEEN